VFMNAAEAIQGKLDQGLVEVSVDDSSPDFVRIAISDNGEGIPEDRLASIFQKGGSTRSARSGGLGLHWCANATKLLGGTSSATSGGLGHGKTIPLEHPRPAQVGKKAA